MTFLIKVSMEICGLDKSEFCGSTVYPPTSEIEDCECSPARLYLNWSLKGFLISHAAAYYIAMPVASNFFYYY